MGMARNHRTRAVIAIRSLKPRNLEWVCSGRAEPTTQISRCLSATRFEMGTF
jgi:hypothetical protein